MIGLHQLSGSSFSSFILTTSYIAAPPFTIQLRLFYMRDRKDQIRNLHSDLVYITSRILDIGELEGFHPVYHLL
jgi:hypothetical protein